MKRGLPAYFVMFRFVDLLIYYDQYLKEAQCYLSIFLRSSRFILRVLISTATSNRMTCRNALSEYRNQESTLFSPQEAHKKIPSLSQPTTHPTTNNISMQANPIQNELHTRKTPRQTLALPLPFPSINLPEPAFSLFTRPHQTRTVSHPKLPRKAARAS